MSDLISINEKGLEILKLRKKYNITRKELSDALEFDKSQEKLLALWENNSIEVPEDIYLKITNFLNNRPNFKKTEKSYNFTQIDLFAGIGGIRLGFQKYGGKTVFSSEWDKFAQKTYMMNFGECPAGDITLISEKIIPDHDILLAGFPCQPFSQAGRKLGFEDSRGTLFFDIARIIKEKRPKAFMLENVKQLKNHDKGRTLGIILDILNDLNYYVPTPEILNAYHFGVPQNRERIFIVGFNKDYLPLNFREFKFPIGHINQSLYVGSILQNHVDEKYTISDKLLSGHINRKIAHNLKGNGFGFSIFNSESKYTNTISARYFKDGSEALIEQKNRNPRMLTPRECARLQGFPEEFVIPVSNNQAYKQFGNSVCVNVIESVAKSMLDYLKSYNVI